jgi:L-asparagine transporter-like permease
MLKSTSKSQRAPQTTVWVEATPTKQQMSLTELVFIGVGGIIGAGFFLGCGLPIRTAGPAVLISFLVGALITAQVLGALTSVAASYPIEGSFKVYADMFLGKFAGYLQGWTYYITSILTISSESVAMGIFTQVWFPHFPTGLSSSGYALIILGINLFGMKSFGRIESIMTVVKLGALVGFLVFAAYLLFGHGANTPHLPLRVHGKSGFFPTGFSGVMSSMLIVIFAYAGIGVFGTAAVELRRKEQITAGGAWTLAILTTLYVLTIGAILLIEPWWGLNTSTSPFVAAFQHAHFGWLAQAVNAVILIASFGVMAGAVFSASQILYSLGKAREAPRLVMYETKRGVRMGALGLTTIGIAIALTISYLLPANVYNFLISASSFFSFFNWLMILWTFLKWKKKMQVEKKPIQISRLSFGQPVSVVLTMVVILVLAGYALLQRDQRFGFYSFIVILLIVAVSRRFTKSLVQKEESSNGTDD